MTIISDHFSLSMNAYTGRILHGDFSESLKDRVAGYLVRYQDFDEIDSPAIPYLSAWRLKSRTIWYEFIGHRLAALLDCAPEAAGTAFQSAVVERRTLTIGAETGRDARVIRESCRTEVGGKGAGPTMEALCRVSLGTGRFLWLKDQCRMETLPDDRIGLGFGTLTVVTREIEAGENAGQVGENLKNALDQIKTLSRLLPVCAACKIRRDDPGYWDRVNAYVDSLADGERHPGLCPDCLKRLYPDLYPEDDPNLDEIRDEIVDFDMVLK